MWFVAAVCGAAVGVIAQRLLSRRHAPVSVGSGSVITSKPDPLAAQALPTVAPSDDIASLLDAMPDGVVLADASGAVLMRNAAARAMTGLRHVDILVADSIDIVLGQVAASGRKAEERVTFTGPPRSSFVITARPLTPTSRLLAVVRDVSDRARVESLRTDFVANVSHELKTPLGAAVVLAEALADEVAAPAPDLVATARLARRVVDENTRLATLVDELLELSTVEFGGEIRREMLDVRSVVVDSQSRVADTAARHRIEIDLTQVPTGLQVSADRGQLICALSNLFENAVKYSEPCSVVTAVAHVEGSDCVITVEDQGVGIPAADLDRIFERFYRVDRARSRATGGTGLGLSLVRHVARNHQGSVAVRSVEGEGSSFTLTIPTAVAS